MCIKALQGKMILGRMLVCILFSVSFIVVFALLSVSIKFIDEDEGLIAELQASPKDELVIKRLTPKPN